MANSKTSLNGYEYGRNPKTTAPFWGGSGEGAEIDDTAVVTDKTWSSKKISDELAEKADASDLASYAKVTSVYTKSESYSKAEVDALIDEIPAVDAYTKTQTDALLANKADKADTYTKTQTDSLLANKAGVNSVYTKGQTDRLLSDKANAADVYTKTQTDNLVQGKVDRSELADYAKVTSVYTKSQTYTKTEVDNLIAGAGGGVEIDDTAVVANKTWSSMKIDDEIYNATSGKANSADVYTKSQTDNLLTGYAKSTSVYTKSQTYTKSEVDNLISQAGGETGVKRFILKPYEISGITDMYGASEALSHNSYSFDMVAIDSQNESKQIYPLIITRGDGSTVKFEFSSSDLIPWNENDTNSNYPKADAVYRKISVGGMDLGVCFTGNHLIDNNYFPDVIIAVDTSLDIASIAINTTDYTFSMFALGATYSNNTPEALFRDYTAYPRKDEVWEKDYTQLVRYQENRGLQYYQFYDDTWHSCLYTLDNEVHIFSNYEGSTLACSQFGNQVEFVIKLKSGVSFNANQKVKIGWCSRDPIGADGIKINGFVYDDSSYFNIDGASCIIYKHSGDSDIYLGFKSNYTTTGNEIIRFSYFIDVNS